MEYEVIEAKVWKNKVNGRKASIYGAVPWRSDKEKKEWELVVTGWTVRNPHTNEVGIGHLPWKTKKEAEEFAKKYKPSRFLMYD